MALSPLLLLSMSTRRLSRRNQRLPSLHNVRNDITKKIESLKERSDYFKNLTGRETFKLKLQVSKPENLEWFLAFDDEECEGFAEEFLRRDI